MRLTLYKYHGQNKDYLVYDTIKNHKKLNESMIRMLCDRNRGLGSDGLITGPFLEDDTIGVQVYGPDGSEKNEDSKAFPVFAKYLKDNLYVTRERFHLQTPEGAVTIHYDNEDATDVTVTTKDAAGTVSSSSSRATAIGTVILSPEYLESLVA